MGSASLAVIYFFLIVSSVLIPSYAIERLTAKWTMVAAMLCYSGYILAQFYPSYATLVYRDRLKSVRQVCCCSLSLLSQLACSIHATWCIDFSRSLHTTEGGGLRSRI